MSNSSPIKKTIRPDHYAIFSKVKNSRSNIYIEQIDNYDRIISYNKELSKNWQEYFSTINPLVVEIGSGSGNFLLKKAEQEPQQNYIGFEIRYKRIVRAMQKYLKNSLHNILLVQRKVELLSDYFDPCSVKTIFVNFPDPWAKPRKHKHRLLSENFFADAYHILTSGGNIFFKTDCKEYFFSVKTLVASSSTFSVQNCYYLQNPSRNAIITEFENLFFNKNQTIYAANFVKK